MRGFFAALLDAPFSAHTDVHTLRGPPFLGEEGARLLGSCVLQDGFFFNLHVSGVVGGKISWKANPRTLVLEREVTFRLLLQIMREL